MIIIYISQRCVEAIKPRRNSNYDAGIVLIDAISNVKTTSNPKSSDTDTGQPHVNEEQNPQNNNTTSAF